MDDVDLYTHNLLGTFHFSQFAGPLPTTPVHHQPHFLDTPTHPVHNAFSNVHNIHSDDTPPLQLSPWSPQSPVGCVFPLDTAAPPPLLADDPLFPAWEEHLKMICSDASILVGSGSAEDSCRGDACNSSLYAENSVGSSGSVGSFTPTCSPKPSPQQQPQSMLQTRNNDNPSACKQTPSGSSTVGNNNNNNTTTNNNAATSNGVGASSSSSINNINIAFSPRDHSALTSVPTALFAADAITLPPTHPLSHTAHHHMHHSHHHQHHIHVRKPPRPALRPVPRVPTLISMSHPQSSSAATSKPPMVSLSCLAPTQTISPTTPALAPVCATSAITQPPPTTRSNSTSSRSRGSARSASASASTATNAVSSAAAAAATCPPQTGRRRFCHVCRSPKDSSRVVLCSSGRVSHVFCAGCVQRRLGRTFEEVLLERDWLCPKCQGVCPCSKCRKRQ